MNLDELIVQLQEVQSLNGNVGVHFSIEFGEGTFMNFARPTPSKYNVFLAVPNAGSILPCCAMAFAQSTANKHNITFSPQQFGDIPHNFNMLWCNALQMRGEPNNITHFAMLHTDIGANTFWLDTLIEEMDRLDADIMSTIVAIKDGRGLTTTGIRYPGVWGTRRFTMKEIMRLPETFSVTDTDEPDQILAINTGLWVCRLPQSGWPDKMPGFQNEHKITWINNEPCPMFDSEDWMFSDWAASQGLKVYATRKVKAGHQGAYTFENDSAWGAWGTELQRPSRPISQALKSKPAPNITIETDHPLATESYDHVHPLGTANDNSLSYAFNRKLFELVRAEDCRVLDLGCAGGGFVRSILEAGGFAVGIEGSDFSAKCKRAEWANIPDYLFTADATQPFCLKNCEPEPITFNVITGWEFWEHIAEDQIGAVLANIKRHAEPGARLIGSISRNVEPHHQTAKPKNWWVARFIEAGLTHDHMAEEHFGNDLVRGEHNPKAISQSVVMVL